MIILQAIVVSSLWINGYAFTSRLNPQQGKILLKTREFCSKRISKDSINMSNMLNQQFQHTKLGYSLRSIGSTIRSTFKSNLGQPHSSSSLHASIAIDSISDGSNKQSSLFVNPGLFYMKIKGRILNTWGFYCAFITFLTTFIFYPFVLSSAFLSDLLGNKNQRRLLDWVVHYWAKACIFFCGGAPTLIGAENLPAKDEVVVYVPNHTSFLDILYFSGFVPRPFKYLSKAEIARIPLIGTAMQLAMHIFLKRNDLQSTLQSTALCVKRLKDGNSMVLFAEGTRSSDGRLKSFKKGAFQIAKEAEVKVVPVSIGNLYRWMPNSAILPLAPMRNTFIKIHPALDTKSLSVGQLKRMCLEAVNSGLPDYQKSENVASSSE